MSNFSDKCKELLESNGMNVYRFSKKSGLERTTLQRMVKGERLPRAEFVKQFCSHLRIPPLEIQDVMKLYEIEITGEKVYQSRQYIKNLLYTLSGLDTSNLDIHYTACQGNAEDIIQSASKAHQMISSVLEHEFSSSDAPFIRTNLPPDTLPLYKSLTLLYNKYKKNAHVTHLIQFHLNPVSTKNPVCNLEALNYTCPFFLSSPVDYQPFYYYGRISDRDASLLIFPYYLITSDRVLVFSADLERSFLYTESDVVSTYGLEFERIFQFGRPLMEHADTPLQAMGCYTKSQKMQQSIPTHVLHAQPCAAYMLHQFTFLPEILTCCTKLEMSQLTETVSHFFYSLLHSPYKMFFSDEGLRYFCKTGSFTGQLARYFEPLCVSERIEALKKLINHNRETSCICRMSVIPSLIPSNISVELYHEQRVQFIIFKDEMKFQFLSIEESSICESFYDFFESLSEKQHSLSQQKTNAVLHTYCEMLGNKNGVKDTCFD